MHCRYVMCYDTRCFQRNNLIIFTSGRVDLSPAGGQCFREGQYRLTTIGFSIKWRDCFAFITLSPLCILHVIECTHLLHICVQRLMQPCLLCSSSHILPFSCTIMENNIFNTAWIYAVLKNRGLNGKKNKVLHQRGWRALWCLRLLFCLKENAWQLFSVPLHSVISIYFFFYFHLLTAHARTMLVLFGSGFLQWECSGYWGGFIRWLQKLWLTAENTAVAGWECWGNGWRKGSIDLYRCVSDSVFTDGKNEQAAQRFSLKKGHCPNTWLTLTRCTFVQNMLQIDSATDT